MSVLSASMSVHYVHAVPEEARRGNQIHWNQSQDNHHMGTGNWTFLFCKNKAF